MGCGFNPRIFCLHVLCCYETLFGKQCFGNFFPYRGLFLLVILCISKNYEHFLVVFTSVMVRVAKFFMLQEMS